MVRVTVKAEREVMNSWEGTQTLEESEEEEERRHLVDDGRIWPGCLLYEAGYKQVRGFTVRYELKCVYIQTSDYCL